MRLKPGQTAPQMPPRGPKGPIKNPGGVRAAGNPRTPRDIGSGNRPTGGTRGMAGAGAPQKMQFMGDMLRQQSGMTGGPKPKPFQQAAAQQAAQERAQRAATMTGGPRAVNTGPRTPPPSTVVNPVRPRGAGAALGNAFGAKKGGAVGTSKMGKVKTNSRPDGVAERGLTKAKKPVMKTMARGGKTC